MKLKINLATKRYLNLRLLNLLLWGAFTLLFMFLLFQVKQSAYLAGELRRIEGETAAQVRSGRAEVVSDAQYKALTSRLTFANAILERKALNWLGLLDYLEEVVPDGVALTQLEPSPHEQSVKITGIARNFSNLRLFWENMERSQHFSEVYLLGQSEAKVGLTQQGIVFQLSSRVSYR